MLSQFDGGTRRISVVVPCFNESDGLHRFHARLSGVLETVPNRAEIIYVNDGSADDTLDILQHIQGRDGRTGIVNLSRNFGKELALTAGIDHASGEAVIVMDADLQDPPECIPEMIDAWRQGFDVVAMKRGDRASDSWFKRMSALLYYRLLARLSPVPIPENIGDFRLLSRRAVDAVRSLPERNRYMKGLFAWIGFNTTVLEYRREARDAGESKLSVLGLIGLALDGITSFSIAPLRLASLGGALVASGAFFYGAGILVKTLLFGDAVAGFPTLIVMISFLGGAQLMATGLLGEYVGRLLIESKQRPLYIVDTISVPHDRQRQAMPKRQAAL